MAVYYKSVDPTINDNSSQGYQLNDQWRNINTDSLYEMLYSDGNWVYLRNTYIHPNEIKPTLNPTMTTLPTATTTTLGGVIVGSGLTITPSGVLSSQISANVLTLQGDWNAQTNTPNISSTTNVGYCWRVSVSGTTNLGGISTWYVGDLAVKSDNGWIKIDNQQMTAIWGSIQGNILSQTDLQNQFASKLDVTGYTAQVNADWDAVSGTTPYILNKPTKLSQFTNDGFVPTGRTVNGHNLGGDVTVTASDVQAYTTAQTNTLLSGFVPTATTVNGHNLGSNVTVTASDVQAYTTAQTNTLLSGKLDVTAYTANIPTATTTTLGGVVVGSGLTVTANGLLSVTGGTSSFVNVVDKKQHIAHGFNTQPAISTINSGGLFTLPISTPYTVNINGVTAIPNADKTINIQSTAEWTGYTATQRYGQWFVWMNANGTLGTSKSTWDIKNLGAIPVSTAYNDPINGWNRLGKEYHDDTRNLDYHYQQHFTVGTTWISGFTSLTVGTGVVGNTTNTFALSGGTIADEDINTVIGNKTTCSLVYTASGGAAMTFDTESTGFIKLNAGVPQYDNAGTLTNLTNNYFTYVDVYATNAMYGASIVMVQGQAQYNSTSGAINAPQPTLIGFTTAEWKWLYRIIVQREGGTCQWVQNIPYYNKLTGTNVSGGFSTNTPSLADSDNVFVEAPTNKTYMVCLSNPYSKMYYEITLSTSSGTCTVNYRINTTSVSGWSSIAVTSTPQTISTSSNNIAAVGNSISFIITNVSSAIDLQISAKYTR